MEPKRIIKLTWTTVSIFFLAALNSSRVLDNSSRNLELSIWDCSHNCKIKGKKVIKAQNPTSTHCSKSSFFVQKFNFDFPRKLSIFLGEKLVKMLGFGQNWILGQKFDFSDSVFYSTYLSVVNFSVLPTFFFIGWSNMVCSGCTATSISTSTFSVSFSVVSVCTVAASSISYICGLQRRRWFLWSVVWVARNLK